MKKSKFKTETACRFTEEWIDAFAERATLRYEKLDVPTGYGNTRLLSVNHEKKDLKPLLFIPGARTCGIFWDINDNLYIFGGRYRIYLIDVVGQPGLSDGNCPNLKDQSYGVWLDEVCRAIGFEKGVCIGASFGGLLIFKLAAVAPERVEKAVLMNPVGLSNISFHPRSLYHTLLPVFFPSRRNAAKFLRKIVFTETETLDEERFEKLTDYVENSIRNFAFGGEYPSKLPDEEIRNLKAETYIFVGDRDGLIPYLNTIKRGQELLPDLRGIEIFPETGHGIEVSRKAVEKLKEILD